MSAHIKRILVTAVGVVGIGGCWHHTSTTSQTIPQQPSTTASITTTTSSTTSPSAEAQRQMAEERQAADQQRQAAQQQAADQQRLAANEQEQAARRQLQAAQRSEQAAAQLRATQQQAEQAQRQQIDQAQRQAQTAQQEAEQAQREADRVQQQQQFAQRQMAQQQQQRPGGEIRVSPALAQGCSLSVDTMHHSPQFESDSSFVLMRDQPILQQVAACVTTGQLKGHTLVLVGRTDSRGNDQYNMVLGAARAAEVSDVLIGMGVPASQVSATSRGKQDAKGTTPSSQALDRRVDIGVK